MQNFDWSRFTRKIAIKNSFAAIYDAWTKAAEIERWFLEDCVFHLNEAAIDEQANVGAGATYNWKWFLYDEREQGSIIAANGRDFIQFTFAGQCTVDVELRQQDEWVIVALIQYGIPDDEGAKRDIRLGCHAGWSFYLANLKSVYEGGVDLRNKETSLGRMLNN